VLRSKCTHPHMVRTAIADLAASLLTYAVDDFDIAEDDIDEMWVEPVGEVCNEIRSTIYGDVPIPVLQ